VRWTADWCAAYQNVTGQIADAMPEFQLAGCARPIQVAGIDIDISETEMIQMKRTIEDKLDDHGRNLIARLVLAMEPQVTLYRDGEVSFDLATLQKMTLLTVRKYLLDRDRVRVKNPMDW
jgi:hypothetical protein